MACLVMYMKCLGTFLAWISVQWVMLDEIITILSMCMLDEIITILSMFLQAFRPSWVMFFFFLVNSD